jgi:deoxycytidylate deaminase
VISQKGEHPQHKLGCIIAKKGKVVGLGFNQLKTHPKSPHPFGSIHAEFSAILGVDPGELHGATAYVYRQYKSGQPALAKPCKYCERVLRDCGISSVVYTVSDGFKEERY